MRRNSIDGLQIKQKIYVIMIYTSLFFFQTDIHSNDIHKYVDIVYVNNTKSMIINKDR